MKANEYSPNLYNTFILKRSRHVYNYYDYSNYELQQSDI